VVETSPHSLSVRYGGSDKRYSRGDPVYPFFQRIHAKFSTSRRRSAHASSVFNGSSTHLTGAMHS
jgi:hypothetical protein